MSDINKQAAYKGSYGVFLETVNQADNPVESAIMDTLNKHSGKMEMKELINSVNASSSDVFQAISSLEKYSMIAITRTNNEEYVSVK